MTLPGQNKLVGPRQPGDTGEPQAKEKGPRHVTAPEALFVLALEESHFRESLSSVLASF
jgi:hypothetical protein